MKAYDYLLYTELEKTATKTNTTDGCIVWHFPYQSSAEQFSKCLEAMGILGSTGQKKYVAQHIRGNPNFGVILTQANIQKINEMLAKINTPSEKLNAKILADDISNNFTWLYSIHYRNSHAAISNLIKALNIYSTTGDLNANFDAKQSYGQGSTTQPNQIGLTFLSAVNPELHGNIIQTIAAIRDRTSHMFNEEDQKLADALDTAVQALNNHFGDSPAPVSQNRIGFSN